MGKTPGKWIKTLLGKKSSKSNVSKGREKPISANREESLVPSTVTVSNLPAGLPLVSPPVPETGATNMVDSEKAVTVKLPNAGVNSMKENEIEQMKINPGSEEGSERTKHEEAARKVQAVFRGHRARRAFRTLKGIIRLQALIRGHMVRRKAVATLFCVWEIVKLQALARGRKARCSGIGVEVQKKHPGLFLDDKTSEPFGVSTFVRVEKLSKYAIVRKLLASSPTGMHLSLRLDPVEPNSDWEWLERWTRLRFWEPPSQAVRNLGSKYQAKSGNGQTVETEQERPKRSVRKLSSSNTENNSSHSTSEHEKPKRTTRKVSGQAIDSAREHPKTENDKVKHHSRKITNSTKEASTRLEFTNEKPKNSLRKASNSAASDVPEKAANESAEKRKDMTVALSKQYDIEIDGKLPVADNSVKESPDNLAIDSLAVENNGKTESIRGTNMELYSKDDNIANGNLKASERRASLPAKIDHQDNGLHSARKVPSYMAPTESARAKLRGQGSPRFSQDGVEKNGITRRHSLPSSASGKLNSPSSRAQRLVQAAGKGVINSDKSLSSSRDAGEKMPKAEWRR